MTLRRTGVPEPMSPEQAESLGIAIDTSIHVERPSTDTIVRPDSLAVPPADTTP